MNAEKLTKWSKEIYDNAVAHGWHEEKHSPEHYLGLIMTEVAEAVEADRKSRYAKTNLMENVMKVQSESEYGLTQQWYDTWFDVYYNEYVKGSVDEEFADIVIRLLDMAYAIHGENVEYIHERFIGTHFHKNLPFIVNAWNFVRYILDFGWIEINDSIRFIYDWAEHLGIDLDKHIEWKMKYNSLREYKHGGKK